jgi:tyrosyl-tRNA synthetase
MDHKTSTKTAKTTEGSDKIDEILSRNVAEVIDRGHLENALRSGKKLRIKLGIDPTAKLIHIGRAVQLWKLRELQDLGHKIILIIGDFTGLIGDTSDKDSERPMMHKKEVVENMKNYVAQIGKILDLKKTEFHHNSEWLAKLDFLEIAEMADQFSLHEFEARENIARRMKESKRVSLREVLYPLMQGYDSVAIKANVELGGTDQRFNLLAGRTLQKIYGQEAQDIMTFNLLVGTDGRKMSSSWGNVINITDTPAEIYGKTMSIPDKTEDGRDLIYEYFIACTRLPMAELLKMAAEIGSGMLNPRDAKARLAKELVSIYHGEKAALAAEAEFNKVHKNKEMPDEILEFKLIGLEIVKVLTEAAAAKSASQAKRLIDQKGVKINGTLVASYSQIVHFGDIIQIGKRKFIKIK